MEADNTFTKKNFVKSEQLQTNKIQKTCSEINNGVLFMYETKFNFTKAEKSSFNPGPQLAL